MFLVVPRTATEQVRFCGFRRNSSSLDKAPKIRDSVRLNSFESFFSDPSFNFFRNLGIDFWAISGSIVFRDWVFLVFSGVSLETAANFLLFLNVAMLLSEKLCQLWRVNWSFLFLTKLLISFYLGVDLRANNLKEDKTVNDLYKRYNTRGLSNYIKKIIIVSPIFTFSLAESINVYAPNQGTNREKYFNHFIY